MDYKVRETESGEWLIENDRKGREPMDWKVRQTKSGRWSIESDIVGVAGYVNTSGDGLYYGIVSYQKRNVQVVVTKSFGVAVGLVIDAIIEN